MRIKLEPVASLTPHPTNPRRDHDVRSIAESIRAFGFRQPVVVYDGDGHVLAGHGRLLAAKELGLEKVPVHHVAADELTPAQAAAYRLADNRSAEGSAWDDALLLAEIELLGERERQQAGFDAAYLDDLRRRQELEGLADADPTEDDLPEVPIEPVSRRGDLWRLGNHRLLCGDATSNENVARLLDAAMPNMVWCDPPYGIKTAISDGKKHGASLIARNKFAPVINDDSTVVAIDVFDVCTRFNPVVMIWWGANHYAYHMPPSSCWLVWDKVTGSNDFGDAELAWTNMKRAVQLFRHQWSGLMKASERGERRIHPTQKPVALASWCFAEFGKLGDIVLDLFLGSAPSLIAAERMGRKMMGMELAPGYVDVAILRWQAETGKQATLDGTDQTFDELRDLRAAERVAGDAA